MSLFPKYGKSTPSNFRKALAFAIGASELSPFIAGRRKSATLNFGNTATQTSADLTITVKGAKVGEQVILGSPVVPANCMYSAFVSAEDTVTVRFNNYSTGPINPDSGEFTVTVVPSVEAE